MISFEDWLSAYGARVALIVGGTRESVGSLKVQTLKRSDMCMVLRVDTRHGAFVVKAYDTGSPDARARFARDVPVCLALRGSGMAPAVRGYSMRDCFFVSDFVNGETVQSRIDTGNLPAMAFAIGHWFAAYTDHMDQRTSATSPVCSNWLEYLSHYDAFPDDRLTSSHRRFLAAQPIDRTSIAKNDAHLSNFLTDPTERVVGLDFEAAAEKPVGWDILLTARVLARAFPDAHEPAIAALLQGWGRGAGLVEPEAFREIASIFAVATGFREFDQNRTAVAAELERFNSRSPQKAARAFFLPFADDTLVPPDPSAVAAFRAHLQAQAQLADPFPEKSIDDFAGAAEPEIRVRAACGTCRGMCCNEGAAKHAFLQAEDIARVMSDSGITRCDAAVGHYLDHLPARHVQGSCLFHGEGGCVLPRKIRAGICNTHLCPSLKDILGQTGDGEPTLLVARQGAHSRRTAILSG